MEEKKIICPIRTTWIKGMLSVLPVELAKKLAPYVDCLTDKEKEELGLKSKKE